MRHRRSRGSLSVVLLSAGLVGLVGSCGGAAPQDLQDLSLRDSLYVNPSTGLPFSGPVFKPFPDIPEQVQLEGSLRDGFWEGELVVYHANGRVRYMGSFAEGARCGPWTENADSVATESVYDQLVREVESMGLYPPCEELQ